MDGAQCEPGESPMDSKQFRKHGYNLIDYISNYLNSIEKRRVTPLNIQPGYLKSLIQPDAPEKGESFAKIMDDFESHIMCGITHWQHPHFHAYFPAGNAYASILADMLSDALGANGFSWAASPAYTELEIIMLDWMGKMIGLPEEFLCLSSQSKGGGVIQGSASECVLVNLVAARHWAIEKLRRKYPGVADGLLLSKLIGYCSKEAHSCVEKAAMVGFIRMRALDTDDKHSLRGQTLAKAIEQDIANGLEPFLVCATLGTTSCCSFDNLHELGQICNERDIWLHVDAAYAGSALICPEFKHLMKGVELASSFNMNPNKWMLINFDCSLMWVKDRFKLTRAFVVDPLYLQHSFSDQAIDYRHWGIALSRRFRSLKLWFVIRNYGVEGLRQYIRNHVKLAKLFESYIRQDPRFTITNEVVLGLVCFRLVGSNSLNQRLLSMINASGKLHMVPASLNNRYVIRFCVCDQNAKEADIEYAYKCVSEFASELFELVRAGKERIRAISQQNTIDISSISLHTQQSASSDRLSGARKDEDAEQQVAAGTELDRRAQRASMLRRNSRQGTTLTECSELSAGEPAELVRPGNKLVKQSSVGADLLSSAATEDDLEREICLQSEGGLEDNYDDDDLDVDLDDDDYDYQDDYQDDHLNDQHDGRDHDQDQDYLDGQGGPEAARTRSSESSAFANHSQLEQGDSRSPLARYAATANRKHEHPDEAADQLFTLAQRRNRMSLRYKREFFVRVVSDPRVYRASISGDINAHASTSSLGGVAAGCASPKEAAGGPAR